MIKITKKFTFLTGLEGWASVPQSSPEKISMALYGDRRRGDLPLSSYSISLRTTCTRLSDASTENYWIWNGTWEDLGVPNGFNVKSVKMDYLYRWLGGHKGGHTYNPIIDSFTTGTGPAELLEEGGGVLGTFSDRIYCPSRSSNEWTGYPLSYIEIGDQTAEPHTFGACIDMWGFNPFTWNGMYYKSYREINYRICEIPISWGRALSQKIIIDHPSDTVINLRLWNLMPSRDGSDQSAIRFRQRRIFLEIEYDDTPLSYNTLPIFFGND